MVACDVLGYDPSFTILGVHVDVVATSTFVEVAACRAPILALRTALGVVEGDGFDGSVVVVVLGIIEVDVGASGIAVQVAVHAFEVAAAIVWREGVGPVVADDAFRGRAAGRADVEVGDEGGICIVAAGRLVEQVDVVALGAAALVQVLVDDFPAPSLIGVHERVHLALRAADDHHVGDEVRGQ